MDLYHEEEAEFSGGTGIITGTAVYKIETEMHLDADIGGIDGEMHTASLLCVECGGATITVDQIKDLIGGKALTRAEERIAEKWAEICND